MKRKIYTKEMKESILKEIEETGNVAQVSRHHEISVKTLYAWRNQAKHKDWKATSANAVNTRTYIPNAQEFKSLEKENQKLKTVLGEKDLEIAILRDVLKKANPGYRIN